MSNQSRSTFIPAVLSAWLSFLVLDFLVHAVFLAAWWKSTEAYWLPPAALFQMIPFGYGSFAIYCAGMVWLQRRLLGSLPGMLASIRLAAIIGMAFGCSSVLATYSILRMPQSALLVWPLSLLVESIGAAIASCLVLRAARPWLSVLLVFAFSVLLFVLGIALQNMFFPRALH